MFKKLLQNIVYVLKKLKGKSFKRQLEFSSNLDQSDYFDFFFVEINNYLYLCTERYQGKIETDTTLIQSIDVKELREKFAIGHVEPFMGGGLFLQIMFVNHPQDIYSAWVYSFVDEGREVVTGYECRMFRKEEGKSSYHTKQELIDKVVSNPNHKLW